MSEDNSELNTQDHALEQSEGSTPREDPFDRLYVRYAQQALRKHMDPPSRERWDEIVLRLISSEDPERVRLYRRIEAVGDDTLGGDAFALWSKMPTYMPDRSIPAKTVREVNEYAAEHRGSMRRLMESRGLGDKYHAIVSTPKPQRSRLSIDPEDPADKPRVRRSQTSVLIIGCAGMGTLLLMLLSALLLIGLGMAR